MLCVVSSMVFTLGLFPKYDIFITARWKGQAEVGSSITAVRVVQQPL
jgi:hypothetical protein